MYLIVKTSNRISNVEKCSFSELGFNERQHLQEWLANHPEAFGEELLIIQKEFAGFDETNERLDLLAIDKEGNLVIIENKLDDTGKDVVWQSIKYASYCSSLSKQQIVQIFQEFIDKEQPSAGADAHTALCNFLDCSDLSETDLNQRTSQRLILVAANYRKEVTSTALWLIDNGLQVQCFKATPYQLTIENNDTYLLNMEQIIPTPEAKDFMINMASKNAEEKQTKHKRTTQQKFRKDFWRYALEQLVTSECRLFDNKSATHDNWLGVTAGFAGVQYTLTINNKELRVGLEFVSHSKERNTEIYEKIEQERHVIEDRFGQALCWLPQEHRKISRIHFATDVDDIEQNKWPELTKWFVEYIQKLEQAFKPSLEKIMPDYVARKPKHK